MTGHDGAHPTEIARLRGARLVVCSEQTSGKRFDESKVKRLTGGDVLTGRFMRGDFFDFPPSHLTWVLSNHLPAVREGGPRGEYERFPSCMSSPKTSGFPICTSNC